MKIHRPKYSAFFLCLFLFFSLTVSARETTSDYYQIKIYHYKTQSQGDVILHYLELAYLPAMHRAGIKDMGVFEPVSQSDTARRIYVFTPFTSLKQLTGIDRQLQADEKYQTDGKDYIDADYKAPPYDRSETILLHAFPGMPLPAVPQLTAAKKDRVYELRSYESPTEKYNVNKVTMFNVGNEIGLFKRLGFNAAFYAEVIAGSHMPNLMYMTTFNSKDDRDRHWDAFNNAPEWKVLIAAPAYQHNVSYADITFLHPFEFSDL